VFKPDRFQNSGSGWNRPPRRASSRPGRNCCSSRGFTCSHCTDGPGAGPPGSLATQDTNVAGIAADFTECRRKEGVLSVKIRFRNTSPTQANIYVINGRNYAAVYVTAANKKYFMLKDSEGAYLTPLTDGIGTLSVSLPTGGQYIWWAKFPAPPADVKKITLMTPVAPPFEDVPVNDQ
jgi:hypothetical protein